MCGPQLHETTHFRTCIKSGIFERAGVPDTANEDNRGIKETISLQRIEDESGRDVHEHNSLGITTTNHLHLIHNYSIPLTHY